MFAVCASAIPPPRHMHLRGRRMLTQLIRADGSEEAPLGYTDGYDWNYQGTYGFVQRPERRLQLFPGDRLITHCRFDTTNNVNYAQHGGGPTAEHVTYGEDTLSEMCFNFVSYYPRHRALSLLIRAMGTGDPAGQVAPYSPYSVPATSTCPTDARASD